MAPSKSPVLKASFAAVLYFSALEAFPLCCPSPACRVMNQAIHISMVTDQASQISTVTYQGMHISTYEPYFGQSQQIHPCQRRRIQLECCSLYMICSLCLLCRLKATEYTRNMAAPEPANRQPGNSASAGIQASQLQHHPDLHGAPHQCRPTPDDE